MNTNNFFATKYLPYLPTEEKLTRRNKKEKKIFKKKLGKTK